MGVDYISLLLTQSDCWFSYLFVACSEDIEYQFACLHGARNRFCHFVHTLEPVHQSLSVELQHLVAEDLREMQNRATQLFEDAFPRETRMQLTLEFVQGLHRKTLTQQRWIKNTLNTTIKQSVVDIRERYQKNVHELRAERIILIKQKVKMEQESDVKLDSPIDLRGKSFLFAIFAIARVAQFDFYV